MLTTQLLHFNFKNEGCQSIAKIPRITPLHGNEFIDLEPESTRYLIP